MNPGGGVAIPAPRAAMVATLLAAAALTAIAVRYAGVAGPDPWDRQIDGIVAGLVGSPGSLRPLILLFGPLSTVLASITLFLVCLLCRRWRLAALSILGPATTGLVNTGLQAIVARSLNGGDALPSGHTAAATCTALIVVLVLSGLTGWRTAITAAIGACIVVVVAGAMSLTLITNGLHVASDVVAGFCCAVATVISTGLIIDHAANLHYSKRSRNGCSSAIFSPNSAPSPESR